MTGTCLSTLSFCRDCAPLSKSCGAERTGRVLTEQDLILLNSRNTEVKTSKLIRAVGALLTLSGAMVVNAPCLAQDAAVKDAFRQGAQAMHQGRTAEAETSFRRAVKLAPAMPDAHLDLGLVLGRQGKLDEAIAQLREALKLDNTLPSGHMFLGIFLYQENHPEQASRELQAELSAQPDNVEALTWLGTLDLAQDRPERAIVPLDHAAALAPNDLNVLELRARSHSLVAKDTYARMAKLDPGSWHVHHVQAQLDADQGKHTDAIAEYQAAIQLQPDDPDLYEEMGDEYRANSQLEAAEAAYRKGLALGPANPTALYNLGSAEVERGQSAEGVPMLERALASYPGSPLAEYYLGRGLNDLGRDQEAVAWLKKAAAAGANTELTKRTYYELTRVYRKLHQTIEAKSALAEFNRLRVLQDQEGSQQVQDWKKLGQVSSAGPEAR